MFEFICHVFFLFILLDPKQLFAYWESIYAIVCLASQIFYSSLLTYNYVLHGLERPPIL
jgi:hypothetical protein